MVKYISNQLPVETLTAKPIKSWCNFKHNMDDSHTNRDYKIEQLLDETYQTVETVPGLKTALYPHQKVIVRAMLDLENNSEFEITKSRIDKDKLGHIVNKSADVYNVAVNAGILSEKVGSGKTFDILALVLLQPIPKGPGYDIEHILHTPLAERKQSRIGMVVKKTFSYVFRPTLIFVGSSVIRQWATTIKTYTNLKTFVVLGLREYEELVKMITNRTVEEFDVILIKNGTVARAILPPNVPLLKVNDITTPHIYSLLANIKGICWARVVIDDFDTIRLKENSLTINAVFTWYVSSTRKAMKVSQLKHFNSSEQTNLSDLLYYGNFPVSSITTNSILYYNCNMRNNPKFVEKTGQLPTPKFYAYKYKNPNAKLVNIMNTLSAEMREVVEMINADAIETAAERLGIKTTTTAGIFEKILGDQYDTMLFLCKILKFIDEQRALVDQRDPWYSAEASGTYGIRRLEKFEPIDKDYPEIDKFLTEQYGKYTEQKNKAMITLNRIKEHITEGECPVCFQELKDECEGKVVIFKCCSIIICEPCCFNTIFHKKHAAVCPNCRMNVGLMDLIYINKEINLEELVKNVEEGTLGDNKTIAPPKHDAAPVKKADYGKYDAIVDIVRGVEVPNKTEVRVVIPQLMTGPAQLPEAKVKKVLIFANYDETLKKIQEKFHEEKIKYEQLGGTYKQIAEMVERFQTSDAHNVLLICAAKYCAGLNLQMASDLIFAHLMVDENVETQVAGRLIRLGRTTSAKFHYVMFDNEYDQKMLSGRMFASP